jgi:secreted trypsin-like serine protease
MNKVKRNEVLQQTYAESQCMFEFQLALLLKNGTQYCGGVIIDRHWGLTAAHCVKKYVCTVKCPIRRHSIYSTC